MEDFFQDLEAKFTRKFGILEHRHGCILWGGYVDKKGYGVQNVRWPAEGCKKERAHRVAYMIRHKLSPNDMPKVDKNNNSIECSHLCHNKICVNAEHIILEAHSINQDRIHCRDQGHCSKCHEPHCILCKILFSCKFNTSRFISFGI